MCCISCHLLNMFFLYILSYYACETWCLEAAPVTWRTNTNTTEFRMTTDVFPFLFLCFFGAQTKGSTLKRCYTCVLKMNMCLYSTGQSVFFLHPPITFFQHMVYVFERLCQQSRKHGKKFATTLTKTPINSFKTYSQITSIRLYWTVCMRFIRCNGHCQIPPKQLCLTE